jgi:hypothetical protein
MPIFMIENSLVMRIMIGAMITLFLMMLHLFLMLCSLLVPLLIMVKVGLGEIMLLIMHLGKSAMDLLLFIMLAILHMCFYAKNAKVVARKLGSKCKGDKTCIWVPKTVVTNLVGPNKSWVPKTQA